MAFSKGTGARDHTHPTTTRSRLLLAWSVSHDPPAGKPLQDRLFVGCVLLTELPQMSVFLGQDPLTGKMQRARKAANARTEKEAETEPAKMVSELDGNAYLPTAKETLSEFLARWLLGYVALMPKTSTCESYGRRVK